MITAGSKTKRNQAATKSVGSVVAFTDIQLLANDETNKMSLKIDRIAGTR